MSSSLAPVLLVAMPQLQDPNFHRSVVLLVEHSADGALGLVLNRDGDLRLADLCASLEIQWAGDPEASTDWGGPVEPNKGWMLFSNPPPPPATIEAAAAAAGDGFMDDGDLDDEEDEDEPEAHAEGAGLEHEGEYTNGDSPGAITPPHDAIPLQLTHESVEGMDEDDEEDEDDEFEGVDIDAQQILEGVYFGVTLDTLRSVAESSQGKFRLFLGYAGWGPGQLETEISRGDWIIAPADAYAVFNCPNEQLWKHVLGALGVDPSHLISTAGVH